ncbi:hypothetical protein AEAC466_14980 [Asticcacaulis sp. AC466]|uniref:methyltransferase family protein n=1 Tax=Asticcacaulis sp. AC466 TaxID=1282362 RepID=UPI0003C3D6FD|nr:isoprenylcysteine carboxylmethyltransferase family protein [Asticcacaulis sp. AC466]ESQ83163.1 hypothetical protein AEAC466_14980 [Asticcacaulis sp. AC466]
MLITLTATLVGAGYALSEGIVSVHRRAAKHLATSDRGSLAIIWASGFISIFIAFMVAAYPGTGDLPILRTTPAIGVGVFCFGIGLRWYAISHLGRFFTVNVAILDDHRLIDTGLYRWIRHPSYTGWLLAILGLGLCLGNGLSLCILLVPTVSVILWRIAIEERALRGAFGQAYVAYATKTWRLIPYIY